MQKEIKINKDTKISVVLKPVVCQPLVYRLKLEFNIKKNVLGFSKYKTGKEKQQQQEEKWNMITDDRKSFLPFFVSKENVLDRSFLLEWKELSSLKLKPIIL